MVTLVLGPVRSGKSARGAVLAEAAEASGKRVIVALTAAVDPADDEMRARVERHRRDRPPSWTIVETATQTPLPALLRDAPDDACVLVDALGTWLAAHVLELGDLHDAAEKLDAAGTELVDAVEAAVADIIIVGEETGWGIVPAFPQGRLFRDALGRLTQRLAARATRVELVVAGYAVDLRAIGTRVTEMPDA
ncbi:MAG TPA: bifunctional adenosylcobinamide kinase/adenosylcobinamide-phosphate guanylyltransferase [Candidatus Elarobacter sp.]|jgi:adenosylcobinamide kinase/adenosylcobinamide-phosphate guanylyltransferase